MDKQVVITGMGVINAIGNSVESFKEALLADRCGICHRRSTREQHAMVDLCGEIDWEGATSFKSAMEQYPEIEALTQKAVKAVRRASYPMQWATKAAIEAWAQSGLEEEVDSERIGLIISGNGLNYYLQYDAYEDFIRDPEYIKPRYALNFMDTDFVGTLSEIFDIKGEGFTIGGASASGNVAIIKAMQQIRMGIVDVCMIVGAPAYLSEMELQAYVNIGAMDGKHYEDAESAYCPFDEKHSGFIYGQAAGCLIIESKEHAKQRGAHVLAELLGGKIILDSNRLADPNVMGEIKAMKGAIADAQIEEKDIRYINTHGTASALGDQTEVNAIKSVFDNKVEDIYVNSTKGYIGHCLYSAGVVELIASIIQMNNQFIHGNHNLQKPIDVEVNFSKQCVKDVDIPYALSNAFGFGGFNASIVIGKG